MKLFRTFLLINIFAVFCIACSSGEKLNISAQDYYKNFKNEIQKHEWTSFDVVVEYFEKNHKISDLGTSHIYIRHTDYEDLVAIFFPKGNYSVLITNDSIVYISDIYEEIAVFHKNMGINNYYGMLCGENIGHFLSKLEGYSQLLKLGTHICVSDTSEYIRIKKNRIKIKAFQTKKICTQKECFLVDAPIYLFFNPKNNILDSAIDAVGNDKTAQSISNLSHKNHQKFIDSIFDIKSLRYKNYSIQNNDSIYIYSRGVCEDTLFNNDILHHSLINAQNGDTTNLANFLGWTLIYFWNIAIPNNLENMHLPVDNIIYINPVCNNLSFIKRISDTLNISDRTFGAKFMNLKINTYFKRVYLLSPDKKNVYCCSNLIDIDQNAILKAKADYEKQHNLKP